MGSSGFHINHSVAIKEENPVWVGDPDRSSPGPIAHPFGACHDDRRLRCAQSLELACARPRAAARTVRDRHVNADGEPGVAPDSTRARVPDRERSG
jgi:hypothetical protein